MFSKITLAFALVSAPGVWLAAQPAQAPAPVVASTVGDVDAALVDRGQALELASPFLSEAAPQAQLGHDAQLDRLVWNVSDGQDKVRVDAESGDVVELAW